MFYFYGFLDLSKFINISTKTANKGTSVKNLYLLITGSINETTKILEKCEIRNIEIK